MNLDSLTSWWDYGNYLAIAILTDTSEIISYGKGKGLHTVVAPLPTKKRRSALVFDDLCAPRLIGIEKSTQESLYKTQCENIVMTYFLLTSIIDRDHRIMVNKTVRAMFIHPI